MSPKKQFILSFFICLVAFSFLGIMVNGYFEDALFHDINIDNNQSKDYDEDSSDDFFTTPVTDGKGFTAMIIGNDISTNETDAIILVKVDFNTEKIMVCSIPTESKYEITGIDSTGNNYSGSMSFKDTIQNYGTDYLINKIYALTDMKIDYYAVINTSDARRIFNEFCGNTGLRYTVPEAMEYDDIYEDIDLYEGDQYLNGSKAVQLMRYRDYESGNGDVKRCSTQVEVIRAFVKTALNSDNPLKEKLLDETARKNLLSGIKTNVTSSDILENIDFIFSIGKFEFVSVPFRYSALITADNVSSLHEDFNKPFEQE